MSPSMTDADRHPTRAASDPSAPAPSVTLVAARAPTAAHQPAAICPRFHYAVELIGRRWTGAILQALLNGALRFSDLATAVPGLSDRLLTERLRELETEGIVERTVIPARPVRVEYRLTEKGRALDAVLASVATWAETWVAPAVAEAACAAHEAAQAEEAQMAAAPPPAAPAR